MTTNVRITSKAEIIPISRLSDIHLVNAYKRDVRDACFLLKLMLKQALFAYNASLIADISNVTQYLDMDEVQAHEEEMRIRGKRRLKFDPTGYIDRCDTLMRISALMTYLYHTERFTFPKGVYYRDPFCGMRDEKFTVINQPFYKQPWTNTRTTSQF